MPDLASPASYAVAFTPSGHTLTVVADREEMSANAGRDTIFDWHVTGCRSSAELHCVTELVRHAGPARIVALG